MPLVCVADFRAAARRRLPRAIFDFVDGGAGHETTLRANEAAFRRYAFRPRVLTDVSRLDTGAAVLGRHLRIPLLLGPSGMQRLVDPQGELAAARATAAAGAGYVLSVGASRTLEEVAAAAPGADLWFQIYLWDDRAWTRRLLDRAAAAGYRVLCVTVDSKSPGARKYRDLRHGFGASPPRLDIRSTLDAGLHWRWLAGYLAGGPVRAAHLADDRSRVGVSLFRTPTVIQRRMDPAATWDEVRWLRAQWVGPLVVKGVLTAADAAAACASGADGIICSNHGGRVLDGDPASLNALPAVVEVAAEQGREVLLDGGVRTGGDLVRALALGARACLVARPFWWGLAVAGEAGVAQVIDIYQRELESVMTQLGRRCVAELDRASIAELAHPMPAPA